MSPQPIDPDTRRLFLASMEAEVAGLSHWARALRDLLRLRQAEVRALGLSSRTNRPAAAKESPQ